MFWLAHHERCKLIVLCSFTSICHTLSEVKWCESTSLSLGSLMTMSCVFKGTILLTSFFLRALELFDFIVLTTSSYKLSLFLWSLWYNLQRFWCLGIHDPVLIGGTKPLCMSCFWNKLDILPRFTESKLLTFLSTKKARKYNWDTRLVGTSKL